MNSPNALFSVGALRKQTAVQAILETNLATGKHGLVLTAEDAREIVAARNTILRGRGRVEFGVETLRHLVAEFAASGFIAQDDYATTIVDLLEVFYCLKNRSEETISDNNLISAMRSLFEGPCAGSVELLKDYEWEDVLQAVIKAMPRHAWQGAAQYEQ